MGLESLYKYESRNSIYGKFRHFVFEPQLAKIKFFDKNWFPKLAKNKVQVQKVNPVTCQKLSFVKNPEEWAFIVLNSSINPLYRKIEHFSTVGNHEKTLKFKGGVF